MELQALKTSPKDVFITALEYQELSWNKGNNKDEALKKNHPSGNDIIDQLAELASIYMFKKTRFYEAQMSLRAGTLNELVLRYSGMTFKVWLSKYVALAAKELLLETDYNLTTLGKRLGFSGMSSFSRWFIRTQKENASDWRRWAKRRKAKQDSDLLLKVKRAIENGDLDLDSLK